eukprot:CAMPEP_0194131754 /NCGR_PEP_ID=MMETSP0152-20130528/2443_1 /TAXON_ID=1049557 /ORGANISM="Thalassiothrix antarctica, Strain L6-D1" /LENGTH=205 /DNA_ID=CAMNT_0038826627 /DNA_START=17 /DNA_END=634 /DNA_ORIENTATION=+
MPFTSSDTSSSHLNLKEVKKYYDYETKDFITVLHYFCRNGCRKIEDIRTAIKLHPRLVSQATPNGGETPLHFAVAANDLEATKLLLQSDPSTAIIRSSRNGHFGNQMIPLHVAIVSQSSVEIIQTLVQASPKSVRIRDGQGQSVQDLAYECFSDGNSLSACLETFRDAEHRAALRRTNSISNITQLISNENSKSRTPRSYWSPQA